VHDIEDIIKAGNFTGGAITRGVDDKDRCILPREYRDEAEKWGKELNLFPIEKRDPDSEMRDYYLKLHTPESYKMLMQTLFPKGIKTQMAKDRHRDVMEMRQVVTFDTAWRFSIREDLLEVLGKPEKVVLIGVGDGVELWSPEVYERLQLKKAETRKSSVKAISFDVFDEDDLM